MANPVVHFEIQTNALFADPQGNTVGLVSGM
jgi:hypothetical protein